jgi:asparagine synthase (glutamine-hydrolysing)
MCGIVGTVNFGGNPVDAGWLGRACGLLSHRGPDGERTLIEDSGSGPSIGFGHRRLRVIDLNPAADQPMENRGCADEKGSLVIVFNGEIYNYRELRRDLESRSHRFMTDSDTEVILHLYEDLGADCVDPLRGMFAFAIWDRVREQLFLARDRVGKKPLYYRHDGARIWFASEMRAILADGDVPARIDPQAVRGYLALGYVAGDRSVFDGVKRLPPAHRAIFSRSGLTVERYWKLRYEPKATLSESEAAERVRGALDESVQLRLISDVPLGAFLSGGIDSSAVVALMCRQARIPVNTFSIGFDDQQYNELEHARSIARLFHTEHHEFVVSPDLEDVLPKIAWHYGEPYADSSAVPTFHLARLARQHITVALTGDGGDESFAGYRRYVAERLFRTANSLPRLTHGMAAAALDRLPLATSSRSRLYDVRRFLDAVGEPPGFRYASFFGFFATDYSILNPSFERATSAELAVAAFTDAFAAVSARRLAREDRYRNDGARPRSAIALSRLRADDGGREPARIDETARKDHEGVAQDRVAGCGARRHSPAAEGRLRCAARRVAENLAA